MSRDGVHFGASEPRHDGAAIPEAPPVFGDDHYRRLKSCARYRAQVFRPAADRTLRPSAMPDTSARHISPAAISCDSVSVPELTSAPASSGSVAGRADIAKASSPRQSAGLRSELRPEPSATIWPSFNKLT